MRVLPTWQRTFNNRICSNGDIDCDTEHYLVVEKVRERRAVNKQTAHRFHRERFKLTKLNETEGKEHNRVEISNKFAALENLDAEVDINRAWETIREYQNFSRRKRGLLRIEEA
jgi:hypothetical protein